MNVNAEKLAQDLKAIVGEDHVHTGLFERVSYADTALPYDVEEGDLPARRCPRDF